MSLLLGSVAAALALLFSGQVVHRLVRGPRTRAGILEEVRRHLRGGTRERLPGGRTQVRGKLGDLELTVDFHADGRRGTAGPMWRVMAVGPVRVDEAVEARVAGWGEWIDPWMRTSKAVVVAGGVGPSFTVHAERPVSLDHPVVVALRRQGPHLGPGTLYVRRDFMRAEVRFSPRAEDNRPLFSFLRAMSEIAEHGSAHDAWRNGRAARGVPVG